MKVSLLVVAGLMVCAVTLGMNHQMDGASLLSERISNDTLVGAIAVPAPYQQCGPATLECPDKIDNCPGKDWIDCVDSLCYGCSDSEDQYEACQETSERENRCTRWGSNDGECGNRQTIGCDWTWTGGIFGTCTCSAGPPGASTGVDCPHDNCSSP